MDILITYFPILILLFLIIMGIETARRNKKNAQLIAKYNEEVAETNHLLRNILAELKKRNDGKS